LKPRFVFVETFRSFFQNNLKIFWHFFIFLDIFVWLKMALSVIFPKLLKNFLTFFLFFGHFCMTENGIMTKLTYVFSVISKQHRSLTEKSPKKTGWNTVKGNDFDFLDNSISSALHVCCFLGSNCLILHPIKTMFFNELIQFGIDSLSSWTNSNVKTPQLDSGLCFLIGKPTTHNQLNVFWIVCCSVEINTKQLSFLQVVKKLFQQIFWNMESSTFSFIA